MDSAVVEHMASSLPAAANRPAKMRGLVFDFLRVCAEVPSMMAVDPIVPMVAHWCGISERQAEKTLKHLREQGLAQCAGKVPRGRQQFTRYCAVVSHG